MIRLGIAITLLLTIFRETNAETVSQDDITFYLSNDLYSYEQFVTGSYDHLALDPQQDVKIIVHGWRDSVSSTWYLDAKEAYEIRGETNVIGIDWSTHSITLYSIAVRRVESVGYYIALLVLDMSKQLGIPLSRFHIIGHSLGSHIAGFAGQYIQSLGNGEKVGRITGLDPARPTFEYRNRDKRLSDDDADFVDVMHTNGGTLGFQSSIGHIDYFPNGGSKQSGCGILIHNSCSHNRAPIYYYESINSDEFVAVACTSERNFDRGNCDDNERIIMGERVDQTLRGDFYLATASSSPFGLGE